MMRWRPSHAEGRVRLRDPFERRLLHAVRPLFDLASAATTLYQKKRPHIDAVKKGEFYKVGITFEARLG